MMAETGLTNVVYDPNRALDAVGLGRTHQHIVLREGSVVHHRRTGNNSTFAGFVDELLGR